MYDAAREVRFRGVSGSVVTRREGSHSLVARLSLLVRGLAAQLGAVLQASSFGPAQGLHGRKCSAAVVSIVVVICSASCLQSGKVCPPACHFHLA